MQFADLFGMPTDNGEPWGLIDARAAEVHYAVQIHGPLNPEAMPDQIHTYGGGTVQTRYLRRKSLLILISAD